MGPAWDTHKSYRRVIIFIIAAIESMRKNTKNIGKEFGDKKGTSVVLSVIDLVREINTGTLHCDDSHRFFLLFLFVFNDTSSVAQAIRKV
jgi:hypothetical protein